MNKITQVLALTCTLILANSSYAEESWLDSIKSFFSGDTPVKEEAAKEPTKEASNTNIQAATKTLTAIKEQVAVQQAAEMAVGLVPSLTEQLGVTKEQAAGGAGILFGLVKSNLSDGDFSQLSKQVPDMSSLLSAVPAISQSQNALSGLLGKKGGDYVKAFSSAATAYKQFTALGLQPDQIGSYISVVTNYLNSEGGQASADLFKQGLASFTGEES